MTATTKEYDVRIKFVTESYEDALKLAKNNLSDNALQVARISEVYPEKRLISELIERDLNGDVEAVPLFEAPDGN